MQKTDTRSVLALVALALIYCFGFAFVLAVRLRAYEIARWSISHGFVPREIAWLMLLVGKIAAFGAAFAAGLSFWASAEAKRAMYPPKARKSQIVETLVLLGSLLLGALPSLIA